MPKDVTHGVWIEPDDALHYELWMEHPNTESYDGFVPYLRYHGDCDPPHYELRTENGEANESANTLHEALTMLSDALNELTHEEETECPT